MSETTIHPDALGVHQASNAVMEKLRVLLPDDVTPYGVLHAMHCALTYHMRDGVSIAEACWKACTENLNFEAVKCGWCGEEFLSQLGRRFCCVHCWTRDRNHRGSDSIECGDDCDYCNGDEKQRREDWPGEPLLDRLEELLSLTDPVKNQLQPRQRERWFEISAEAASLREGEVE